MTSEEKFDQVARMRTKQINGDKNTVGGRIDMTTSGKEKGRSSYLIMLQNISTDLDTFLTDLSQISNVQETNLSSSNHSLDVISMTSNANTVLQGHAAPKEGSSHSLVNLSDDDLDSVNSRHIKKYRTEPKPLLFDGASFSFQQQERYSPLTSRGDTTTSMDERRPISTEEKLVKTSSIWLLTTMSRAGAVHILKDKETGVFIVRKSSQPDSLALSVQSRLPNHFTVDHYLIQSTSNGFRLQGSAHFFHSIPSLIAYYVENMDEIPYHLRLPSAIQQAKSTRELASLDLLGQDFWMSSFSKTSQTSKLILGVLQKSCSEPINIQQPNQTGATGTRQIILNNLPSKSTSDPSHIIRTQPNVRQYPQLNIHGTRSHTVDRAINKSKKHSESNHHNEACHGSLQSSSHAKATTVTNASLTGISSTSQHITNSDTVVGQFSRESSLENSVLSSNTQNCTCRASEENWTITSDFVVHRQQQNSLSNVGAEDLNIYRTDPSNQLVARTDGVQQLQRGEASLFSSLPLRHQHSPHIHFRRNQMLMDSASMPKSKANLYFTTNLDLLELPENSYFTSKLSDRMSDYEDIWKNSCSESDVDGKSPLLVPDSQFSCDTNNNNDNARAAKQIIVEDTFKHSTSQHIINMGHEAIAKSMLGLTALEQARLIAGSSSDYLDDDTAVPDLMSEDNEEIRNTFTKKSLQMSSSFFNKCSACNMEAFTKQVDVSAVSSFLDLNQQNETDLSFKSETSDVFAGNSTFSASACCFNAPTSINGTGVTPAEQIYASTDNMPTSRSKKDLNICLPSRLDNLSRKKSSSESSLITAPSPPYAEPADTVRLRDKKGRDINIQIRRRSAPSSFRAKDRTGKTQQPKVSQHPELETIFSPGTRSDSSTETRFLFDISNILILPELSHTGGNTFPHERLKTTTKVSVTQNQIHKTSHNKARSKLTLHNLSSLEPQYQRKNLAAAADTDNFQPCIPLISHSAAIMSPPASRFPVGLQQDPRVSCFSDSSTVQDLIFCIHPELSIRPKVADLLKVDETVEGSQSEYDNLGCNTSTLSSLGTVYSPPWDTTSTTRLIEEVQSNHKMLPDMNTQDRIEHWQQANNTYHNSDNLDETVSSCDKNSLGNNSSRLDVHQLQQYSLQQQLLFQHQQKIKTKDSDLKVHSNVTGDSLLNLHQNTAIESSIGKEEQKEKRWSYQGTATKRISPPVTPQSSDDMVIRNKSTGKLLPPLRLSSQCPDVVHNTLAGQDSAAGEDTQETDVFKAAVLPGQVVEEDDVVLRRHGTYLPPLLAQQSSSSQNDDWKTPGTMIREYIVMLSSDRNTIFGSTIENFIQCTVESHERNPQHVMRNVRQFMSGIKNYLVKHGEGELQNLIEIERNKLATNEILNIDAIIEQALHVCVLKPLKYHIYKLFVDTYSQNGALEKLARNIQYARTKSPQELGVKPGLKLPQSKDMEIIKYYLDLMQKSYSPLQKLQNLLKATSAINNCVQSKNHQFRGQRTLSLGADEFLPTLIHVIVHCRLVSAEIEADFMWGLLHPSLMAGEGGYCLTTLSSAVLILKNFEDTHNLSPAQMENRLATMSDMQGFLKIAIPDELNGTITWRTLPVRPNITTRDVCAMVAHKLKVTNPQDYGLFMLFDGLERQLTDNDCPQMMKCDNLAMGKSCCFAFKRIDANIAWPRHMKHSTLTLPDV